MEHYFSDYNNQDDIFCLQDKQIESYNFLTPLDEDSIIFFQKLLLVPQVHYIKIDNLENDRVSFLRLLTSVHHHTRIQYIAPKNLILLEYENMYTHFLCIKCDDTQYSFEQYWLEFSTVHVIWVEIPQDASADYIKQCMDIIAVLETKNIPVFVLH